jgi:hypothetical protein
LRDERREVRARLDFFAALDRQLPSVRGPNGEPSVGDFQVFELLTIVDKFATGFTSLPELIPGGSDYRVMIAATTTRCDGSCTSRTAPDNQGARTLDASPATPDAGPRPSVRTHTIVVSAL